MKKEDLEILNSKKILTVEEVASLLSCSKKSVYRFINNGTIDAVNLGDRLTRIKRSDIDKLFM